MDANTFLFKDSAKKLPAIIIKPKLVKGDIFPMGIELINPLEVNNQSSTFMLSFKKKLAKDITAHKHNTKLHNLSIQRLNFLFASKEFRVIPRPETTKRQAVLGDIGINCEPPAKT